MFIPLYLLLQGCSYIEAVKRAKHNEEIKGTAAYYDDKCLVAEECVRVSAKVVLPLDSPVENLLIAVVVHDENASRVIDAEIINFTPNGDKRVSYVFFDLPVGKYTAYALSMPEQREDLEQSKLDVLAKRSGKIVKSDLKAYQNAVDLNDIYIDTTESDVKFPYPVGLIKKKINHSGQQIGTFEEGIDLNDPLFSHSVALEGLYYPKLFRKKSRGLYRLAPKYKEGSIPLIFVHGMAGTPRDWAYILEHIDLTHYTPYLLYYASGEDFTKLSAEFNAWILSDKIFDKGAGVVIAHSFGGVIVRDASNLQERTGRQNKGLFISLATPYGGDAKATEGVKNAPYVIPSWRSIADDSTFIKELYRKALSEDVTFDLLFAYENGETGPSGDGRVPLQKQLRPEAQEEADVIRGFNEDHLSILNSKEVAAYIDRRLQAFAKAYMEQK